MVEIWCGGYQSAQEGGSELTWIVRWIGIGGGGDSKPHHDRADAGNHCLLQRDHIGSVNYQRRSWG